MLSELMNDMDRIFGGLGGSIFAPFRRSFGDPWSDMPSAWSPQLEVFQRGNRLVVRADVPGLTKDDIDVEVRGDELCIRGERKQEHTEEHEGVYHSERRYGSFCRLVALPEGVNPDTTTATFQNGVLEIQMEAPKSVERGKRIEIREGPPH